MDKRTEKDIKEIEALLKPLLPECWELEKVMVTGYQINMPDPDEIDKDRLRDDAVKARELYDGRMALGGAPENALLSVIIAMLGEEKARGFVSSEMMESMLEKGDALQVDSVLRITALAIQATWEAPKIAVRVSLQGVLSAWIEDTMDKVEKVTEDEACRAWLLSILCCFLEQAPAHMGLVRFDSEPITTFVSRCRSIIQMWTDYLNPALQPVSDERLETLMLMFVESAKVDAETKHHLKVVKR